MRRRRFLRALIVAALLTLAAVSVAHGAAEPKPGQRVDLKVLLVAATGTEPGFSAWKADLEREGVPYDTIVADNADGTITDARLADYGANRAYYQAVILATGDLEHAVTNGTTTTYPSALTDAEWASLAKLESTFGIRQLSDATQPSPAHGLNFATVTGEQSGTATLTAAGLSVFPYLQGPVAFDPTFGYQATPANPANFQTLLTGPAGNSYLGIYTHPGDGREEMVLTVASNQFMTQDQLLRHGMLNWVTRGVYLGHQRNYFETQVDDIFLPDDRWDTVAKKTGVDGATTATDEYQCNATGIPNPAQPDCRPIRMLPTDVTRLISWQNANGVKLDMVFNGGGSVEWSDEHPVNNQPGPDPLLDAFLPNRFAFSWINHTYDHPNLDTVTTDTISSEILDNVNWAQSKGIPLDPKELVTGEHSGLHNANMPAALAARGVRWIAADNSREPNQYAIGSATTVPRYPSNVYYNVGTLAEQLDEYNYIYLPPPAGRCVNSATNTCRTAPATWAEYVASEVGIMFGHLMGNDPKPHYAHQSNIAEEGVLYAVLDSLLARYRASFKPPLVQMTHTQIGEELARQAKWRQDLAAGRASAYVKDGQITITTTATLEVPVTGVPTVGSDYGGTRSGWTTVSPGAPLVAAVRSAATGASTAPARTRPASKPRIKITSLKVSPKQVSQKRFAATGKGRAKKARSTGARVTWRVSAPRHWAGTMRLSVQRVVTGRKVAGACVPTSQRNRKRRACARYRSVGTITKRARRGDGAVKLTGRVAGHRLKPATYRILAMATGRDRRGSAPVAVRFGVKRR